MDDEERLLYGNRLPDDFPQRLARLRELAGLTWSGFAKAIGVDYRQMYKWRQARRRAKRSRNGPPLQVRQPDARRSGDPPGEGIPDDLPQGLTP